MNAARLSADDLLRFYAALDVARAHAATAELNERMQAAGRDYSERKAGVTYGEMWYAEDAASAAHLRGCAAIPLLQLPAPLGLSSLTGATGGVNRRHQQPMGPDPPVAAA